MNIKFNSSKFNIKSVIITMVLVLLLSIFVPTLYNANADNVNQDNTSIAQNIPNASDDSIENVLHNIDSVHIDQSDLNGVDNDIVDYQSQLSNKMNTWQCTLSIGQLLVTDAIPYAKILKIKKYLQVLGGVKQTVKFIKMFKTGFFAAKKIRNTVGALIGELSGVTDVYNYCIK